MMQENCQFTGHGHQRPLLRVLAPPGGQGHPHAPEIRVWPERSENVMRARDEQSSKAGVARLGDPKLGGLFPRLVLSRPQPQIRTQGSAFLESPWIFDREDISECGQGADPHHLPQRPRLGVSIIGHALDLAIELCDPRAEGLNHLHRSEQGRAQRLRYSLRELGSKASGRTLGYTSSECLDRATNMIHQLRSGSDQRIPRSQKCQVRLTDRTSMTNRPEEVGIQTRQTSQPLRVNPIALAVIFVNRAELAGVGNQDLMTALLEQPRNPRRVGPYLQGNPQRGTTCQPSTDGFCGGHHPTFLIDLSPAVKDTKVAKPIADVQTDRQGFNARGIMFHDRPPFWASSPFASGDHTVLREGGRPSHPIWFAGYAYYGAPGVFEITGGQYGGMMADDGVPVTLDAIADYGKLGFNTAGYVACPGGGFVYNGGGQNGPIFNGGGDGPSGGYQVVNGSVPADIARLGLQPIRQLPDTMQMNLAIGLPLRNREELTGFVQAVSDPTSPNYRQYLTLDEFAQRFGPTTQDYQGAVAFAQSSHLTVTCTYPNRVVLNVAASVADIQNALHVTLHEYNHPTENRTFFAPDTEPSLDLAVPIASIDGLNNYFLPHPSISRPRSHAKPTSIQTPGTGSGPNGTFIGRDFWMAYVPGVSETGSHQKVGIVADWEGIVESDITEYEDRTNLPRHVPVKNVRLDGYNGEYDGAEEVSLDLETRTGLGHRIRRHGGQQHPRSDGDSYINQPTQLQHQF